jgi:RsiW-degrading membrane proteinase PrsW (M82 family)
MTQPPSVPPGHPPTSPAGHPTGILAGPAQAPEFPTAAQAWAAAPPPPKPMQWKRVLLLVGLVVLFGLTGLALLIFVGVNIGPMGLAIGIVSAVIPVPLLVYAFLWLDRYEPEPILYLGFCFAWGAIIATSVALAVNTGAQVLLERLNYPEALVAVLVAPFIEEIMKFLGPLLLFWRRRRAFSGIIDSIVYCGLSATGFAFVENILYLGGLGYAQGSEDGGALGGAQGVVALFFARILMMGFAHPLFTSMTAIGLGVAARSADRRVRWLAPLAGLLAAMMLHGAWNLMATLVQQTQQPLIFLYGYFAVMVPIFLGMVGYALWLRSAEGKLTQRVLPEYVRRGWLAPPEVASLGTVGRRLAARRWAKRVAGDAGAKAMGAYQFDLTKLALLRDGIRRGLGTQPNEINQTLAEERRLLDAIVAYRRVFGGRDPQVPQAVWDGQQYHVTFPDGAVRSLPEPEQPVVPVPVRFGPPVPAFGYPGYAPPGQVPGYPPPGYAGGY